MCCGNSDSKKNGLNNMKKKKLIQINTVCNGSTGNLMRQIQLAAQEKGYDTLSFYGRRKGYADLPCKRFGSFLGFWLHVIWTTLTDRHGLGSRIATGKMVEELRKERPDIIHLHNLHGYYLNYPILFKFLREEFKGKIVWTFHDCWPITGHCPHFIIRQCDKWKNQCDKCPNKENYPISYFLDSSKDNYRLKKKLFTNMENLTILCPSQWMLDIVKQSFLADTKAVVVPNGIDLKIFYPRKQYKDIEKYHIPRDKKVILGVASVWEERKGLSTFIRLAKELEESYVIVLVGLSRIQLKKMNPSMIGIRRTENKEELAQLYSRANVFLNPSEEESFSLVTVEAMACGTPAVVLDSSAVKELVNEETGVVLHHPKLKDYIRAISICENKKAVKDIERYSVKGMTDKIMEIYEGNILV